MKILFMGTTDFAVSCLAAMRKAGYEAAAVCTKVDKPKNRGMKLQFSPVKEYALEAGLPILQPESLKDEAVRQALAAYEADLFVVVAYGKLLPRAVLELPRLGCINVHGSLLPRYRGAAPIQWAVLNGERETGVSTMYLAEGMDAGDVLEQASLPVGETESFGSVYERLKVLGGELLVSTLGLLERGEAQPRRQEEALVTYAPPLTKAHQELDWNLPQRQVISRICGLDPRPGARARLGSGEYKVFSPRMTENLTELPVGSLVSQGKNGVEVACGDGRTVLITELQAPGGKRMRAADYLRGHSL